MFKFKNKKLIVVMTLLLSLLCLAGCAPAEKPAEKVDETKIKSEMGDTVVIDFEGYLNGKKFEGGSASQYFVTIGSNTFIDNFEEQLIGHKIGDEFDVNVTFPESYLNKDLEGKDVVFKVKMHEVWRKIASDLD